MVPRCLCQDIPMPCNSVRLVGFCDASSKACATVVYVRLENEDSVDVAAKIQITPVGGMSIPRLELLSDVKLEADYWH